jgi:hypothetical protein
MAGQIAVALANLTLKAVLLRQVIRDPFTGFSPALYGRDS